MNLLFILSVIALAMLPCMKALLNGELKSGVINIRDNLRTVPSDVVTMGLYFPLSNWLEYAGMKVDHEAHKPQPKKANKPQPKKAWFKTPTFTQMDSIIPYEQWDKMLHGNMNHPGNHKKATLKSIISRINGKFRDFKPEYTTTATKYIEYKSEIAGIVKDLREIYESSRSEKEKAQSKLVLEDLRTGMMYIEAYLCRQKWWLEEATKIGKSFPAFAISKDNVELHPLLRLKW